jgi:UDP-N-acetylmuramate--alanine ligase
MVKIEGYSNIYMIGIGGIGMSALARYFIAGGWHVAGYDRISTNLTKELEQEGADIHYSEQPDMVKAVYRVPGETLVIYTPAIPAGQSEFKYFRNSGFTVLKRSEVLGMLSLGHKCIAVAGTHGKTTISTLAAHLLNTAGIPVMAFLGGISKNYNTNALIDKDSEWMVAEADEFDRSFLRLFPDIAIVTSCDPDHLDIYGNKEVLELSFRQFIAQVRSGGSIIIKREIESLASGKNDARIFTYSLYEGADFFSDKLEPSDNGYKFDLHTPGKIITGLRTGFPGLVNVENAIAAAALGYIMGTSEKTIRRTLDTFRGVRRRFDIHINREDVVYIDDYGHHPKELESFIRSVRALYPGRKITGIFQPHLYSRTRDFAEGFAASLSELDELILLDIYPARELPIEGVTSDIIFSKVKLSGKRQCIKMDLMNELKNIKPDVLLTMGAGDIDTFVEPIISYLNRKG